MCARVTRSGTSTQRHGDRHTGPRAKKNKKAKTTKQASKRTLNVFLVDANFRTGLRRLPCSHRNLKSASAASKSGSERSSSVCGWTGAGTDGRTHARTHTNTHVHARTRVQKHTESANEWLFKTRARTRAYARTRAWSCGQQSVSSFRRL